MLDEDTSTQVPRIVHTFRILLDGSSGAADPGGWGGVGGVSRVTGPPALSDSSA